PRKRGRVTNPLPCLRGRVGVGAWGDSVTLGPLVEIVIEQLAGPTPDAERLIAELDAVLGALYEPEQRHGLSIEQVFQPNLRFFVAHLGDQAVGCGALALFDGYGEVKRMYTCEAARGRGVGKALLA